jgi:3-hydroxyacyl-[acyl-carrier-protein] dehydratase
MNNSKDFILNLLPHRYPFLMVDMVEELNSDKCIAWKDVTPEEPCFEGHFPGEPIFPGVLTIEALAQTCAICLRSVHPQSLPIFAGIENARFFKPVLPGHRMRLEVTLKGIKKGFYTFEAKATVDNEAACEAAVVIYMKD